MAGLELTTPDSQPATAAAFDAIKALLARGFILLPEGEQANVLSLTPPLTITWADLARTIDALAEVLP